MKEVELRALIRESNVKPVRVCMDDGKSYTIAHPDFGMVADGALIVGSWAGHQLGDVSFVVCYFEHISRVEQIKAKSKSG
jgi:hypothetical protein